jgi:uncharacterized protein (TIGR00725 family)
MTGAAPLQIAVVGPSQADETIREYAAAVADRLARSGAVVIVGGGPGVSHVAALAARDAGGVVVGLRPGYQRTDLDGALTVAVATGLGELSNGLVVRAADALISVGGSWGTLIEVALAQRTGVPVVSSYGWRVSTWDGAAVSDPAPALTADEAVTRVLAAAAQRRAGDSLRSG